MPAVKLPSEPPPTAISRSAKPSSARNVARQLEERSNVFRPLQRRTIDAAFDLQLAFLVDRAQLTHSALHRRAVTLVGDAEVNFGDGFAGDNVGARAAANHADVERDAAFRSVICETARI